MTALQKIVLGTPPAAVDGDPVRTASTKMNANVDVFNQQATLTSFATTLTAAQALTAASHLGKRVNVNLAANGVINLPAASTCVPDGVILVRNRGTTVITIAITAGSGDAIAGVTALAGGESILLDTDGVHTWGCVVRSRSSSANEVVQGSLSVSGTGSFASIAVAARINTDAGGVYLGNPSSDPVQFRTNGYRLNPTGSLSGYCDAGTPLFLGSNAFGIIAGFFYGGANFVGGISINNSSTSYGTSSDYRVKSDYAPIDNAASILSRIKFYDGVYTINPDDRQHYVIAHELQEVLPYAVLGAKDAVDENGKIITQSVDYSKLVPVLGAALQEALVRIADLEAKASE